MRVVTITLSILVLLLWMSSNAQRGEMKSRSGVSPRAPATVRKLAVNEYWGNTFGLVIGISHYADSIIEPLNYCDSDAIRFYKFLTRQYGPKADTANITMLINEQANSAAINLAFADWLEKIKPKMQPGDVLYVYWSGHGLVDTTGQKLLAQNTVMQDLSNAALIDAVPLKDIKGRLKYFANTAGIKVYLIIDACRKNIITDDFRKEQDYQARQVSGPGEIYMYAASSDEQSYETKDLIPGSGVFTFFLLLGLEGAADMSPYDKKVTLGELERYMVHVTDYVGRFISKDPDNPLYQIPDIYTVSDANRNFALSKLPADVAARSKRISDSLLTLISTRPPTGSSGLIPRFPFGAGNNPKVHHADAYVFSQATSASTLFDTVGRQVFDSIIAKINRNDLITPKGNSAYDDLLTLKKMPGEKELISQAQPRLYIALFEQVRILIDNYLSGKLNNTGKAVFDLGYDELAYATKLTPDSFMNSGIKPKLVFLKARALAGSNNPKDWNEALTILDTSISKAARASYLYHTKAILYGNKSRFFTARKYYDSALSLAPNWIYALYSYAINAYKLQEFGQSIDTCLNIIRRRPDYSRAYSLIALNKEAIELQRGTFNYQEAIDWNTRALQRDSGNSGAWLNLGRLYTRMMNDRSENIARAKYYYITAAERFKDETAYGLLGKFYFDLGYNYYDSARVYFNKSLSINPYNASTLSEYASLMDITGDTKGGAALLLNALVSTGYDYNIHARYCSYIFKTVSPDTADLIFRQIVHDNHQDPSVFINYSKLYEMRDSLQRARNVLELGLFYIPQSPSLNYALSELYFQYPNNQPTGVNARDSVKKYLNIASSLTPGYSLFDYAKYRMYEQENTDSAAFYLAKATQLNSYIHDTKNFTKNAAELGDTAFMEKKFNLAISHYRIAQSARPKDFDINLSLAQSYYLAGQTDDAYGEINKTRANIRTSDDDVAQQELLALIAFDQKKYEEAYAIFKKLDEGKTFPDNIAQALTLFELHKNKQARAVYRIGQNNDTQGVDTILNSAIPHYSANFIQELQRFLTTIH